MSAMPPPSGFEQPARVPPHNIEAERAFLGALLLNNDVLSKSSFLKPEHFVEEIHQRAFEVAGKMIGEGRVANPITLKTFLGDHDLGGITVPQYLARLAAEATTIINAVDYARMVVDLAVRRRVIESGQAMVAIGYDAPVDHRPSRIIDDGIGALRTIADEMTEQADDESVDRTFGQLIEAAQDRLAGKVATVPTSGFLDVDRTLSGGLLPGRLIVLAGRPGMGKTVVMVAMGRRAAERGTGVGVVSLEIDRKELTARLVANAIADGEHPLDYRDILAGKLDERQIERLCLTRDQMRGLPLEVCEQSGLSMAQIESRTLQMARRLTRQGRRLEILLIDYLQLVQVTDRYKGKLVEELGEIALGAKNLAKRLGISVVLLSQLNRSVEARENKRPVMSDLRGSGNIEEHADAVGLLYRPEYYDKDDPKVIAGNDEALAAAAGRQNLLEIHWAKNRLGPTDTTKLYCDVARSQVENYSSVRGAEHVHELPAPFVPADVDLRHYACMSLDVKRLRDSRFALTVSGEAFRCGVLLWAASWHQVPAGSLPDNDIELSALAGYGRAVSSWLEHRAGALYGWVKCSNGRLYHPVVAEKVVEAWNTTLSHRWRKEVDRVRKENKAREDRQLPPLETPARPLEIQVIVSPRSNSESHDSEREGEMGNPESHCSNPETGCRGSSENSEVQNRSKFGDPETLRQNPENANGEASADPEKTKITPISPIPAERGDSSNGNPPENALNITERNGTDINISCPKRASPLRTRKTYSEGFERFWSAYPTDPNMSKSEAGKVWDRLSDEDQSAALAAVSGFVAYCRGRPDYRPVHAERFLRARRFDGFAPGRKGTDAKTARSPPAFEVRGIPVPEENALAALDRFKRGQPWHRPFGPAPGEPGCVIPQHLLERAGIAA